MTPVDQDGDDESDSALADPEFQAYLANAWAAFQADKKDKGKQVRFDGVQLPPCKTSCPDRHAASVAEDVDSPAIEALWSKSAVPPRVPGSSLPRFPTPSSSSTDTIPTRAEPFIPSSSVTPSRQFRYSFPLEDETAPKHLLDQVLVTTVPVLVRELITVAPDVRKQLKDLATAKHIPISTNTVQVNKLAGHDPGVVDRAFGSCVHHSDDGLIIAHHSIPLWSLEAKIIQTGRTILGVLDSGSEIVAMPKRVWEDLGYRSGQTTL